MGVSLAKRPEDWTETEFDAQLFRNANSLAKTLGWTSYHTLRSRGSKAGFPDRTLYRDRVIFAELKKGREKPTELQVEWLDGLAKAGAEVYLWRPGDYEEIGRILGARWHLRFGGGRWLARDAGETWEPASIWIPGEGRRDGA